MTNLDTMQQPDDDILVPLVDSLSHSRHKLLSVCQLQGMQVLLENRKTKIKFSIGQALSAFD